MEQSGNICIMVCIYYIIRDLSREAQVFLLSLIIGYTNKTDLFYYSKIQFVKYSKIKFSTHKW